MFQCNLALSHASKCVHNSTTNEIIEIKLINLDRNKTRLTFQYNLVMHLKYSLWPTLCYSKTLFVWVKLFETRFIFGISPKQKKPKRKILVCNILLFRYLICYFDKRFLWHYPCDKKGLRVVHVFTCTKLTCPNKDLFIIFGIIVPVYSI